MAELNGELPENFPENSQPAFAWCTEDDPGSMEVTEASFPHGCKVSTGKTAEAV